MWFMANTTLSTLSVIIHISGPSPSWDLTKLWVYPTSFLNVHSFTVHMKFHCFKSLCENLYCSITISFGCISFSGQIYLWTWLLEGQACAVKHGCQKPWGDHARCQQGEHPHPASGSCLWCCRTEVSSVPDISMQYPRISCIQVWEKILHQ